MQGLLLGRKRDIMKKTYADEVSVMVGAISPVNAYYSTYGYQPVSQVRNFPNPESARSVAGQQTTLWAARRPASPDAPVEPVRPVSPIKGEEAQPVRLGPVLREGADPAEMAVRMRIKPYEESTPDVSGKNQDGNSGEMKIGAEGAQAAMEEGKCQTCEERKYQDGSDDMGVSFQTPTQVDPKQAASAVRGHEQEHVVREQAKAQRENRRVVSQSVTIHNDICPECGKVYVSGGTTRTVTAANQAQETMQTAQNEQEQKGFSVFA